MYLYVYIYEVFLMDLMVIIGSWLFVVLVFVYIYILMIVQGVIGYQQLISMVLWINNYNLVLYDGQLIE